MNRILHIDNLAIGYKTGKKKNLLHTGLSADIRPGELVCLAGPNGAGKSTLLKTIAAILPALGGSVHIDELDIKHISSKELSRTIGLVLTDRNFGAISVFDLVSMGRYPYTDFFARLSTKDYRIVLEVLRQTKTSRFRKKAFNNLSDGEKQKVMIARVLAQQTPLMILDEPTAFLDLPGKYEIFRMLSFLAHQQNKAILMTTHDLELAMKFADKLWLLEQGKTFVTGVPEDLVIDNTFSNYFNTTDLLFNKDTGIFETTNQEYKLVRLTGSGNEAFWIEKALIRKGYKVTRDANDCEIIIEGERKYIVSLFGKQSEVTSIGELLKKLEDSGLNGIHF